jgi:hypothetical protein
MSKQQGSSTTTVKPDPATAYMQGQLYNVALGAAGLPTMPSYTSAGYDTPQQQAEAARTAQIVANMGGEKGWSGLYNAARAGRAAGAPGGAGTTGVTQSPGVLTNGSGPGYDLSGLRLDPSQGPGSATANLQLGAGPGYDLSGLRLDPSRGPGSATMTGHLMQGAAGAPGGPAGAPGGAAGGMYGPAAPVPGIDPATGRAEEYYGGMLNFGGNSLAALNGDAGAIQRMMNPYEGQVIQGLLGDADTLNQATMTSVNDAATQARAFGGSRHGIATGKALADNAKNLRKETAALRYAGFESGMNRAMQGANLGFGAAGEMQGMGEYKRQVQMQQDPVMRRLEILKGAMSGAPMGQSTTAPMYRNRAAGALGGAATGAGAASALGLTGPWGWAAAGLGGLLGML